MDDRRKTQENKNKKPNFFIVGGPRCGTSALSEYLRKNRDIFFSQPKELNFFFTDFSPKYRLCVDENTYLERYFSGASRYTAVGEGTPWYLYSKEAIPNILRSNSKAKFIVMVRNPIDMAYSLHAKLLVGGAENVKDFERAWNLQALRMKGQAVPYRCIEPKMLFYKDVCSLGEQVDRLLKIVPRSQVKIVFYNDLKKNPAAVYKEVIDFLGVRQDGHSEFRLVNTNERPKYMIIPTFIRLYQSSKIRSVVEKIKSLLGIESIGVFKFLQRINASRESRQPLDSRFRKILIDEFRPDVLKLQKIVGEKLPYLLG